MRRAALLLLALALAGCETTAEKSARLERAAQHATGAGGGLSRKGLTVTRPSRQVDVVSSTLLHGREGDAVVVTLRNRSATVLREVPLAITVRDAHGAASYSNAAAGLAHSLVSVPLLAAHGETIWVNDQVPATVTAGTVQARAGEAARATGVLPRITVSGVHSAPEGVEGTVTNRSKVEQHELVVYATAERAGRVVAAGRAVLAQLAAGASADFQIFLIGNAGGAPLKVVAPASTLG